MVFCSSSFFPHCCPLDARDGACGQVGRQSISFPGAWASRSLGRYCLFGNGRPLADRRRASYECLSAAKLRLDRNLSRRLASNLRRLPSHLCRRFRCGRFRERICGSRLPWWRWRAQLWCWDTNCRICASASARPRWTTDCCPRSVLGPLQLGIASAVSLAALLPWLVLYEAVVHLGIPQDAIVAYLPFESRLPVLQWTEVFYISVLPGRIACAVRGIGSNRRCEDFAFVRSFRWQSSFRSSCVFH